MGDLRDQLKKANLLSKKDAKRIAHEERVHRKQKGGRELSGIYLFPIQESFSLPINGSR